MSRFRIGVDIGGTFTDFAVLDESTGKIEALKYHSGLQPLPGDLLRGQAMQAPALFAQPQQFAIQPDAAAVDGRQLIDTTQKRRLARSRCPDQAKHLARPDVQRDPLESLKLPEILADGTDRDWRRDLES